MSRPQGSPSAGQRLTHQAEVLGLWGFAAATGPPFSLGVSFVPHFGSGGQPGHVLVQPCKGVAACVDATVSPPDRASFGLLVPLVGQALGSGHTGGPRPVGERWDHTCDA